MLVLTWFVHGILDEIVPEFLVNLLLTEVNSMVHITQPLHDQLQGLLQVTHTACSNKHTIPIQLVTEKHTHRHTDTHHDQLQGLLQVTHTACSNKHTIPIQLVTEKHTHRHTDTQTHTMISCRACFRLPIRPAVTNTQYQYSL